jgi:tetratricopeptide (TPR) repeat protein
MGAFQNAISVYENARQQCTNGKAPQELGVVQRQAEMEKWLKLDRQRRMEKDAQRKKRQQQQQQQQQQPQSRERKNAVTSGGEMSAIPEEEAYPSVIHPNEVKVSASPGVGAEEEVDEEGAELVLPEITNSSLASYSETIYSEDDDLLGLARASLGLADIYMRVKLYATAMEHFQEAYSLCQSRVHDPAMLVSATHGMAICCEHQEKFYQAHCYAKKVEYLLANTCLPYLGDDLNIL